MLEKSGVNISVVNGTLLTAAVEQMRPRSEVEKAGVNISVVMGTLPATAVEQMRSR